MADIGGSMGPLYGTFFREMSKKSKDIANIGAEEFAGMLEAALDGVKNIGNAKAGDKTMLDCLEPAVLAFRETITAGGNFREALAAMKAAAESGRDSTKDMVAKVGRASRLGERSRGVLDAGATSCCVLLCTMADVIDGIMCE
jgi:dihydroxyacetone kinase